MPQARRQEQVDGPRLPDPFSQPAKALEEGTVVPFPGLKGAVRRKTANVLARRGGVEALPEFDAEVEPFESGDNDDKPVHVAPVDALDGGLSLGKVNDRELVARIAEGDEGAFAELQRRYGKMLLSRAKEILHNHEDAKDATQQVWIQVWEKPLQYNHEASAVSSWLILLVNSRAIDLLRRRTTVERTHEGFYREFNRVALNDGPIELLRQDRAARLEEALADIPSEQRQILKYAYFQGLTQSEIAEATGIPIGTVKTRTLLAMKKLRIALGDERNALL